MKLSKQKLKQIIKEELKQHEFENFLNTYVVDNPLYSLDAETSKSLFAGYMQSTGQIPPDVEALQDMYDSLARNMDPEDRSHMSDLMEIIKEELSERTYSLGPISLEVPSKDVSSVLAPILKSITEAYDSLSPDDKVQFESSLLAQIDEYVKIWRYRRDK